jgi:UDP-glucose-4-epimerase GalE
MNVLVIGGAGYVGSHAVKRLMAAGHSPVSLDDLSPGHAEVARLLGAPLVVADMADAGVVERTLREHRIEVVMHFAAFALVGESVANPLTYYDNNVAKTVALLKTMAAAGVHRFIFSSTCAVYGSPERIPVSESEKKAPVSPYGRSKLMVEQILADTARANPGFSYASLRYFNASGAAADGGIGEDHDPETHLIPILLQVALGQRPSVVVYGDDYDTPDGTAVRDYVHVDDLADAHILAMEKLGPGVRIECNLGTGAGFSVKQMVDVAARVTGRRIPVEMGPRRDGDATALYADASLANRLLGWQPKHAGPESIIASAWHWHQRHPNGYGA